jgi:hypothetical protein
MGNGLQDMIMDCPDKPIRSNAGNTSPCYVPINPLGIIPCPETESYHVTINPLGIVAYAMSR